MSTLIVSIPLPAVDGITPGSTDFSYVLTQDGVSVQQQSTAPAALLPHTGRAGETVAVVPIRALSWQRVMLPPGGALSLMPLAPTSLAVLPLDVSAGPLLAEPAVSVLAEATAGRTVQLETTADRWLAASRSRWDMAQFDLASSGRTRVAKRAGALMGELMRAPKWRAARWGAALLLAAQVVGLNAWAWKEQAAVDAQDATVRGVLTTTFPTVRVVVDAPVQMERELVRLRQASGAASPSGAEALLAAAGAVLPAGRSPAAFDFSGTELRLVGLQLQTEEAGNLITALRARGIAARTEGEALLLHNETAP